MAFNLLKALGMLLTSLVVTGVLLGQAPFPLARLERLLALDAHRPVAPAAAPTASRLPCQVVGTLHSHLAPLSLASVQCGKDVRSVREGDLLLDAEIVGIGHGVVIVRRGDVVEELGHEAPRGAPGIVAPNTRPPPAQQRVDRLVVEQFLKEPATLLGQVQFMPAFSAGKWIGVRATQVREGSFIAKLGLTRGDVIVSVNGTRLDDAKNAMAVLQLISSPGRFDIELQRDGATLRQSLTVE